MLRFELKNNNCMLYIFHFLFVMTSQDNNIDLIDSNLHIDIVLALLGNDDLVIVLGRGQAVEPHLQLSRHLADKMGDSFKRVVSVLFRK